MLNSGDTAWMMMATVLAFLMTPGLAFLYAGLVRGKNAVSTLYQCIMAVAVVGVLWAVIGYSLAFSTGTPWIGNAEHLMLIGIGQEPASDQATVPHLLFVLFHMMPAIFAAALLAGAIAERIRFSAWLIVLVAWSFAVQIPITHWLWAPGGWLAQLGAVDFAGGYSVHVAAGCSALVAAIVLGNRRDFGFVELPYDTGRLILGASLLMFGWFGLTAGAALTASGIAAQAFANTFLAAGMGLLGWTMVDRIKDGKPAARSGCMGLIAGLVAITPAAGYVNVPSAILIGLFSGILCAAMVRVISGRFHIDDSQNVFACHGIGGAIGVLMTGLMASSAVNPAIADGLLAGQAGLILANMIALAAVAAYSAGVTFAILKLVNLAIPLRVDDREENTGLDTTQHGETIVIDKAA